IGNSFSIDLIYALRKNALEANVVSLQSSHKCFNFGAAGVSEEHVSHCNDIKKYNFDITNWESANAIYLFDHWPKLDLDNLRNMLLEIRSRSKVPIYVFGPKMVFSRPIPDIVHSCNSASAFAINKFAQQFA